MSQEYYVSSGFLEWMLSFGLLEANVCSCIGPILFFSRASHSYLLPFHVPGGFVLFLLCSLKAVAGSETFVTAHQRFSYKILPAMIK